MKHMSGQEIRERFAQFFMANGHQKISSSSLIPHNDPTLLFANAGMNQFKDYFTGKAVPKNKRAVTIQKCVRAGGKHNDLENVGFTARHHTFFEMLGNFSFGDYFKNEAINLAWKFLTKELGIPAEKLYVTVHESDDEAKEIWHREQGVPYEKIFKKGDKDNFWEMGDVGPCGPCSEIFYDHGPEFSIPNPNAKDLLDDEGRYIEIWNLVFMQYEKTVDKQKILLPKPSVDTGAGLERISALMQGKYYNYDSDIFTPIMNAIEKLSHQKYVSANPLVGSFRVVADHIRSATMLITDGAIPSNEGRGYVLRRIIRRAVRHLDKLGLKEPSFYLLVDSVFESLGKEYPDNANNRELAKKLLQIEEKKFRETLHLGQDYLNKIVKECAGKKVIPGEHVFKLYDTFGFPSDLTQLILEEMDLSFDQNSFDEAMKKQKEQSKKSWKGGVGSDNKIFYTLKEKFGETPFTGYSEISTSAKLLAKEQVGDTTALIFDKTCFYGESGGQVGDQGEILAGKSIIAQIDDTQKPVEGLFVHFSNNADALEVGQTYALKVNAESRALTARNHSATHLLQAALIKVLGTHVKQAGSLVTKEKLRFDFTHPEAVTKDQLREVELIVNQQIQKHHTVCNEVMSKDAAVKKGAMAIFGEKYGDEVRVIQMGEFSTELCGGTHVKNTAEIEYFSIISEASLSSGVRRIEAITSTAAIHRLEERSQSIQRLQQFFGIAEDKILEKVESMANELKEKQKKIESLEDRFQEIEAQQLFTSVQEVKPNHHLLIKDVAANLDLRKLSDLFMAKFPQGTVLFYQTNSGKISVLLRTSNNNKKINCSEILKKNLPVINGRGGGKPELAQGSGDKTSELPVFIQQITKELNQLI